MKTLNSTRIALSLMLALGPGLAAAVCNPDGVPSTPTSRYVLGTDGTVLDQQTGLMWQRCAHGQTWQDGACSGTPVQVDWQQALSATAKQGTGGYEDWRLPNIKELMTLVEWNCTMPTANTEVFAGIPEEGDAFWSSSPVATTDGSAMAWQVDFRYGGLHAAERSSPYDYVRYVRTPR